MKSLINRAVLLTLLLSLVGCTPDNMIPSDWFPTPEPPSTNRSALEYFNSAAFDESLSQAMTQSDAEIEVAVLAPFSSNNIPLRVDNWLTAIKENGGDIYTKPVNGERDMVAAALALYSVYRLIKEKLRYVPAKKYHATLIYRQSENNDVLIEKMVFSRK